MTTAKDNELRELEKNGISKAEAEDLPRLYRWRGESLASFRAKFNASSNLQALDAIDALKAENAELKNTVAKLRHMNSELWASASPDTKSKLCAIWKQAQEYWDAEHGPAKATNDAKG